MINSAQTIYPHLNDNLSDGVLYEYYNILPEETDLLVMNTQKGMSRLCFFVLLKTFKHLGYFIQLNSCPEMIISYLSRSIKTKIKKRYLKSYDKSNIRLTHVRIIRTFFGTKPIDKNVLSKISANVAKENNSLIKIINATINEIRNASFELPAFSSLSRVASASKTKVNSNYYAIIEKCLTKKEKNKLSSIFKHTNTNGDWNRIKWEAKNFSPNNAFDLINHLKWLKLFRVPSSILSKIPEIKLNFFFNEAIAMEYQMIQRLNSSKQLTYAAITINTMTSRIKDNMCQILMHIMKNMETEAKANLLKYKASKTQQAERLVATLKEILLACKNKRNNNTKMEKINCIVGSDSSILIAECNDYNCHKNNHYLSFMVRRYKLRRNILFNIVSELKLSSSTKDKTIIQTMSLMFKYKDLEYGSKQVENYSSIGLSWITERWCNFIYHDKNRNVMNKYHFEICTFMKIADELKSRDLVDGGAHSFGNFNNQLISKTHQKKKYRSFSEIVNLPKKEQEITEDLKKMLQNSCKHLNEKINHIDSITIKKNKIVLKKIKAGKPAANLAIIQQELSRRTPKINIIEIILEISKALDIRKFFGPASGIKVDQEEHLKQLVATLFSFGCNVGASETASIINGITRKQIGRINLHHITEDNIDECIAHLVNHYNKFMLPKYWGTGEHASVDGTHWATYLKNLFSSYHFRYCKQGSVAYYHVSDTYIAIFSNLIPCGAYEALYLLDGVLKNESDIKPDKIHGDTHAQSLAIFGLSYLLGIKIMPRIRKINTLKLFKATKDVFENIDQLFDSVINWDLIDTNINDMVRIAMSVKEGKITASAILNRICNKSSKNKIHFAFVELGRVVRTSFLLEYMGDHSIQKIIHSATCKSEEFNEYVSWVSFANDKIKTNSYKEQRKFIKYNHLVTNMLILYNVHVMSSGINGMIKDGYQVTEDILKQLSPYRKFNLNRLGIFHLKKGQIKNPSLQIMYDLSDF